MRHDVQCHHRFDRTNYCRAFRGDDNLRWHCRWKPTACSTPASVPSAIWTAKCRWCATKWKAAKRRLTILLQRWPPAPISGTTRQGYDRRAQRRRTDITDAAPPLLQTLLYQFRTTGVARAGRFDQARTLQWISQYFGALASRRGALARTARRDGAGRQRKTAGRWRHYLLAALYHVSDGAHPDSWPQPAGAGCWAARRKPPASAAGGASWQRDQRHALRAGPSRLPAAGGQDRPAALPMSARFAACCCRPSRVSPASRLPRPNSTARVPHGLTSSIKPSPTPTCFAIALSDAIARGDWRLFFLERDQVEQLQPADLQRAALNYLLPSNRTFGQFIPR